jgi:hypothetical protein
MSVMWTLAMVVRVLVQAAFLGAMSGAALASQRLATFVYCLAVLLLSLA